MWRLWLTAMVLQSTTTDPARTPSTMPLGPRMTSFAICGIADAEEEDVGVFRDFLRGGAELAFFGAGEFLGFGRGVGPDGDFVSGAEEVAGHGVPHEAESEES